MATASTSRPSSTKLTPTESKLNKVGSNAPNKTITLNDLLKETKLGATPATMDAINSLLRKNLCTLLKSSTGELSYRFRDKDEAKVMGSMDSEEKLVLDQIRDAGNVGIWTKNITIRTGLLRTTITKCLKALEQRKAIKSVKSVKFPTQKTYMLAGLTPSVDITGGPWFTDNELDLEFVAELKKITTRFLVEKSTYKPDPSLLLPTSSTPFLPTVSQIRAFVSRVVLHVELQDEHIESLLQLMVFEGTVEKVMVAGLRGAGGKRGASTENGAGAGAGARGKKRPRKGRKGDKKAKKGRKMLVEDDSGEDDDEEEESDFDSDEEAPRAPSGAGGKRRKKRRKVSHSPPPSDAESSASSASDDGSDSEEEAAAAAAKPGHGGDDDGGSINDYVYRIKRAYAPTIGWTDMPCGRCPVESFCTEPAQSRLPALPLSHSSRARARGANPRIAIESGGGALQGVGMIGGAGAAIGASNERWGEVGGKVGFGVAPVNPRDCHYFAKWLDF